MLNIKTVRERTLAPITKVKEALVACGDNVEAAVAWLKENWKPKDKESAFGNIYTYNHYGRIGVMLEVLCGTDFVAKTREFNDLCHELALQLVAGLEGDLEKQQWIRDASKSVQDLLDEVSKKTGESVKIGRYIRWSV